jgi:hypothetical protein
MRVKDSMDKLARFYVQNIVRLHGVLSVILPDRDSQFTSIFWHRMQHEVGSQLKFNTSFHPQTHGQCERTIQILEDMLQACVLDFKGNWIQYLPLIEFSWNNVCQRQLLGLEIIQHTREKVTLIKYRMLVAQSRKKSYADNRRRELEFEVGDKVFLRISLMRGVMWFNKKGKLSPNFVGPFAIVKKISKLAY